MTTRLLSLPRTLFSYHRLTDHQNIAPEVSCYFIISFTRLVSCLLSSRLTRRCFHELVLDIPLQQSNFSQWQPCLLSHLATLSTTANCTNERSRHRGLVRMTGATFILIQNQSGGVILYACSGTQQKLPRHYSRAWSRSVTEASFTLPSTYLAQLLCRLPATIPRCR